MKLTYWIATLLVITIVLWTYISMLARSHWTSSVSCKRVVGDDGIERDSWSFQAGYADTLLGNTFGKYKVARATAKFNRQQRKREASLAKMIR